MVASPDPRLFIRERRDRWQELETLLERSRGRRKRQLSAVELEELGRHYRQVTSDLAIARRDFPNERVRTYLEQLVGRAHPAIYHRPTSQWQSVTHFVRRGFPRAFREAGPYTAVAFAALAIPFLLALVLTLIDPTIGRIILPPGALVDKIEQGQSWMQIARGDRGLASSFIMANNIRVAIFAFAGGIAFGLVTVLVLAQNGVTLGATAGLAIQHGLGGALISFVSPHGGIEMTVIFISGGAGLRVGYALLRPGLVSRRQALTNAAQRAIPLLIGCVPLLMIAGTLEGFVSPSGIPKFPKFVIGALALTCLYSYLLLAGRGDDASEPAATSGESTTAHSLDRAFVSR
ncbi:MAG TPA: stage II sporulation protein M [Nitrolancea sp.]|nr:stage II sporulation protein M [Nitrolancea sp.]